ncbi:acetate uptake transporter family protein [Saccharopolyspora rosea]|uniref:Acetate uptake transporter family protein n=1 Tax=Saccharopolyspora rosea TaxID=524884 RepID=A0ABW3G029_9PSEU|nr:GPR1/FUN34/YaaH family transporter [Saccharopolyspora rosea]
MSQEHTHSTGPTAETTDTGGWTTAPGPAFWREHTQISLSPVAPPSILGLFGLAAATFMVSANLAGWFGTNGSPLVLFPFAMLFGGLAQFLAGMWAFRARDGLATALHGTWGSFWLAYGTYMLLVVTVGLPAPTASPIAQVAFGYWFIVLAAITWAGAAAAVAENMALTAVLTTLAAGSTLLAIGWVASLTVLVPIGAIVLVASAVIAYYTAAAMMLHGTFGRTVLPLGKPRRLAGAGAETEQALGREFEEPGVKHGQ